MLGESQSPGWQAHGRAAATSLGASQTGRRLRERLARPIVATREFDVVLEWTPQRQRVGRDLDLAGRRAHVSGDRVRRLRARRAGARRIDAVDPGDARVRLEWPVPSRDAAATASGPGADRGAAARGCGRGAGVAPWAGVLTALLLLGMQWRPRLRVVFVLGPAVLLALARASTSCTSSTTSSSRRCSSGPRCSRTPARSAGWRSCSSPPMSSPKGSVGRGAGSRLIRPGMRARRRAEARTVWHRRTGWRAEGRSRRMPDDNRACSRSAISPSRWAAGTRSTGASFSLRAGDKVGLVGPQRRRARRRC